MQRADEVTVDYAAAKAAGNFDVAAVFAGESAGLIHDIPPAAEIVDRVVTEPDKIMNGRRTSFAACPFTPSIHPSEQNHVARPPDHRPLQDRVSNRAGAD